MKLNRTTVTLACTDQTEEALALSGQQTEPSLLHLWYQLPGQRMLSATETTAFWPADVVIHRNNSFLASGCCHPPKQQLPGQRMLLAVSQQQGLVTDDL